MPIANATNFPLVPDTSWTPVLSINGLSTGITYTTQSGLYNRIGGMIFVTINLAIDDLGINVGAVTINLPFVNVGNYALLNCAFNFAALTFPATYFYGSTNVTTSTLTIVQDGPTGTSGITQANLQSGSNLLISGFYRAF